MERILDEICDTLHNYFTKTTDVHRGKFTIENGSLTSDFLQENQYFRIVGSVFNDGVYCFPYNELTDEEFNGEVWAMSVPTALRELLTDITAWENTYGYGGSNASMNYSPFTSESFNNYSYSKGSKTGGTATSSASPMTWKDVFGEKLRRWKRL